ncbi:MAG: RraA family protein [Verrucomicrobia bacterium]|nr:RraA family protein [Verrucomicrobiota bacterium]
MSNPISPAQIDALRRFDTCTVANAIETFNMRLRDVGFADSSVRCVFPKMPPLVGYAATVRIRYSGPPVEGRVAVERTDWWNKLLAVPAPRVVVIQDVSERPGFGSFIGEVHAHVLKSLGCIGAVTNGSVHDLPGIGAAGFHLFAGSVAVSHAYVHIVDFDKPVEVGGLKVNPGDLLHADQHGVLSVPPEIAADIPAAAERLLERERKVIELCRSGETSVEKLRDAVKGVFHEP